MFPLHRCLFHLAASAARKHLTLRSLRTLRSLQLFPLQVLPAVTTLASLSLGLCLSTSLMNPSTPTCLSTNGLHVLNHRTSTLLSSVLWHFIVFSKIPVLNHISFTRSLLRFSLEPLQTIPSPRHREMTFRLNIKNSLMSSMKYKPTCSRSTGRTISRLIWRKAPLRLSVVSFLFLLASSKLSETSSMSTFKPVSFLLQIHLTALPSYSLRRKTAPSGSASTSEVLTELPRRTGIRCR